MHAGLLSLFQVGIIRQVEVELDNTLRDLRDSHKEESAKLKKWRALDKDVQAKLADFPIQGMHLLCSLHMVIRLQPSTHGCSELAQGIDGLACGLHSAF